MDPVTPEHVMNAVKENKCKLTKVLTTHHHWDHAGGNENLKCLMPDLHFYGGDTRIGALTTKVKHGSVINLGNLKIECLHTPCHTQGHICYFVTKDGTEPAVFTGNRKKGNLKLNLKTALLILSYFSQVIHYSVLDVVDFLKELLKKCTMLSIAFWLNFQMKRYDNFEIQIKYDSKYSKLLKKIFFLFLGFRKFTVVMNTQLIISSLHVR